jgi:hypothetical protein
LSSLTFPEPVRWSRMQYRGKSYTIVQSFGPDSWKWTIRLDEKTIKSGEAPSRAAAKNSVIWAIDQALKPKKMTIIPRSDGQPDVT